MCRSVDGFRKADLAPRYQLSALLFLVSTACSAGRDPGLGHASTPDSGLTPPNGSRDAAADPLGPDGRDPSDPGEPADAGASGDMLLQGVPDAGSDASACEPSGSLVCSPLQELPENLRDTGFFPVAGNLDTLHPRLRAFVPAIQLWSDGLSKRRALLLPPGGKIDVTKRDAWVFPVGTIFIKTFLADGPTGPRPVETRFIRRTDHPDPFEQYAYDVYRWNEGGTEATLLSIDERTPIQVRVGGRIHTHQIPSRNDCKKCHGANDTSIIGFDEIRLNVALESDGQTQLEAFASAAFFSQALPSPAAKIVASDPLTLRVKSYVYGNCYHCHNGNDTQVFDMHPDGFVEAVVGKETMASGTAPGIRVVPRNPEMSVLYRQMTRMNLMVGYNAMPPVGVQVADPEALLLVRQWIMSLP
jgi:hypothetical protein